MKDLDRDIAEINGLLDAFCWLNGHTNHGYEFHLTAFEKSGSLEESLKQVYAGNLQIERELAGDWRKIVAKRIQHWFFLYRTVPRRGVKFVDEHKVFDQSTWRGRRTLVLQLIQRIERLEPLQAAFIAQSWAEQGFNDEEHFILEGNKQAFWLSFGVSD